MLVRRNSFSQRHHWFFQLCPKWQRQRQGKSSLYTSYCVDPWRNWQVHQAPPLPPCFHVWQQLKKECIQQDCGWTFLMIYPPTDSDLVKDQGWADGSFLPFQQVWAGASAQSLPLAKVQGMAKAHTNGFDFTFAKSNKKGSYFSTLKSMKEVHQWVSSLVSRY